MSLQQLLQQNRLKTHTTSQNEVDAIRAVVKRDLDDASIEQLSADRRFATAYNAALQSAKLLLACEGYRPTSAAGHHWATLQAAKHVLGRTHAPLLLYFDTCRTKRNKADYDVVGIVSDTEADELVAKATEFRDVVADHIRQHHSHLA